MASFLWHYKFASYFCTLYLVALAASIGRAIQWCTERLGLHPWESGRVARKFRSFQLNRFSLEALDTRFCLECHARALTNILLHFQRQRSAVFYHNCNPFWNCLRWHQLDLGFHRDLQWGGWMRRISFGSQWTWKNAVSHLCECLALGSINEMRWLRQFHIHAFVSSGLLLAYLSTWIPSTWFYREVRWKLLWVLPMCYPVPFSSVLQLAWFMIWCQWDALVPTPGSSRHFSFSSGGINLGECISAFYFFILVFSQCSLCYFLGRTRFRRIGTSTTTWCC